MHWICLLWIGNGYVEFMISIMIICNKYDLPMASVEQTWKYLMLHTMFQGSRPLGSREEDF